MSGVTCTARTERCQLFLQPRPETSKENIFDIRSGYQVKIQLRRGTDSCHHLSIESRKADGETSQISNFSIERRTFEMLISKDVQKIPVTLSGGDKSKTIEWRAPFARLPIELEVRGRKCTILMEEEKEESDLRDFAPPKEQKEASGSKEGKKNDEAVLRADSINADSTCASSSGALSTGAVSTSAANTNVSSTSAVSTGAVSTSAASKNAIESG